MSRIANQWSAQASAPKRLFRTLFPWIWAAAALVAIPVSAYAQQGPYSGVTLDTLLDTPIRGHDALLDASGAEILTHGGNMSVGQVDGYEVAITEDGFWLEVSGQLPAGVASLLLEVNAPTTGTDSYFAWLDGQQLPDHFVLPYQTFGTISVTATFDEPGQHTFRLEHRENPGSAIRRIAFGGSLASSRPAMIPDLVGQHPRLLLTHDDVPRLQQLLGDPRVQELYRVPGVLEDSPPPYQPGSTGGEYSDLARYALGHKLEPNPAQLAAVLDWLTMATTYGPIDVDLSTNVFLQGIALTYDWLYDEIPEPLRTQVRDLIADKCRAVFEASLSSGAYWGDTFQQNHYWHNSFAVALGGAALYGEIPEAEQWLLWAWDRFERMLLTFSPEGSFHEGPGYWGSSMPTMYLFTDLYEQLTGQSIAFGNEGLAGQAQFRFHYLYPGLELTAAMEDTRKAAGKPAQRLLLWEAKRFQDPVTMGLADATRTGRSSYHLDLLWLDAQLGSQPLAEAVPLGKQYEDVGTAFARTSWQNDASYFAFVSRALGGLKYADVCDQYGLGGTGHNHPAQNHFVLFGRGEVLAGDPGYTYEKLTRNHNTVLVDGQGQFGDAEMWPGTTPGRSHLTDFVTDGDISIAGGDATSAYPEELTLTNFHRWVVLAGRDLVVVQDRLAATEPRTFSWLLHHYGSLVEEPGRSVVTRNAAQLTVRPVRPADATPTTETYLPQYIHTSGKDITPEEPNVSLLELRTGPATDATFVVPLLISDAGTQAPEVGDLSQPEFDAIRVLDTVVAFNRTDGSITVPLPWDETLTTDAKVIVARLRDGEQQIVTAPDASSAASGPPPASASEDGDGCGCRLAGRSRQAASMGLLTALFELGARN